MELSFIFFIITLVSTTSGNVNVVYLSGVPRLNNSAYWDYYFCCNTTGSTLLWEVNGNSLGGFLKGDVARVLSSTRSNFNYTATLLSSQPTTGVQSIFDSVLIVSLLGRSSLDVACGNGPSFSSTNNAESRMEVRSETSDSVFLERLLPQPLVNGRSYNTRIFVCGVENQYMTWQRNVNFFVLTRSDRIGLDQQNLQQNDTFERQQAILIGHEPYQVVSVLFVMDTSDVVVECGYYQNILQLPSTSEDTTTSEDMVTTQSSTAMSPEPTTSNTSSSTTTGDGTMDAALPSPNSMYTIIGVLSGVIVLVIIVSTVIIVIVVSIKKPKTSPGREPGSVVPLSEMKLPSPDPVIDIQSRVKIIAPKSVSYKWLDDNQLEIKQLNDENAYDEAQ